MAIWILALLLVAGLAYVGYAQGAIRVAFSLLGIITGWLIAVPMSVPVGALFKKMGVNDPVMPVICGGLLVFLIVSSLFKAAALVVHRKIENHYKHRTSETEFMLWERLNQRAGACMSVVNATLYLVLISGLIYGFGYWTTQMARAEGDPFSLRTLNMAARGLESSGFIRTAGAITRLDQSFYDTADLAGVLYNNPSAVERLADYPAFMSFAERPEFQGLRGLAQSNQSLVRLMAEPQVQNIVTNKELFGELTAIVSRDLKDLTEYLRTGRAAKYEDEKIVGHWKFSVNGSLAQVRAARPNITSKEMAVVRQVWNAGFSRTLIVVTPDRLVFVKGSALPAPNAVPGAAPELKTYKGQWEESAGGYKLTLEGESGEKKVTLLDGRLILTQAGITSLAFNREL